MTGEEIESLSDGPPTWRAPPLPQPGSRPPAPGDLGLVQSFINSHYDLEIDRGADLFASADSLMAWLVRRELLARRPTPALTLSDVRRARVIREGLRGLASANGDPTHQRSQTAAGAIAGLNQAARGAAVELRFSEAGPRFVAAARSGLNHALGLVLGITAGAMLDGSWFRMKVCPGEHCGWAFYDHSRNQSGRWCSMAVCGGRAKARAHYRRRRAGAE